MTKKTLPAPSHMFTGRDANVGENERLISTAVGGLLFLNGLTGRGEQRALWLCSGAALVWRGFSGYCPLYGAMGVPSHKKSPKGVAAQHGVKFETSLLINRPADELYETWSHLELLPQVMSHLISVSPQGEGKTHWVAKTPLGFNLEWDAEIIEQRPSEVISWQSLPGSQVDTAGSVHFRKVPNRGTEVRVSLKYDPPGGAITAYVADFFALGIAESVERDLWKFKQNCETGEIATVEGQTSGRESAPASSRSIEEARI